MIDSHRDSQETISYPDEAPLPTGRGVRLPAGKAKLGGAIPVRFEPETIELVKSIAEAEGLTVSSWIRREISNSLRRRALDLDNAQLAPVISIQSRLPQESKTNHRLFEPPPKAQYV